MFFLAHKAFFHFWKKKVQFFEPISCLSMSWFHWYVFFLLFDSIDIKKCFFRLRILCNQLCAICDFSNGRRNIENKIEKKPKNSSIGVFPSRSCQYLMSVWNVCCLRNALLNNWQYKAKEIHEREEGKRRKSEQRRITVIKEREKTPSRRKLRINCWQVDRSVDENEYSSHRCSIWFSAKRSMFSSLILTWRNQLK